RRHTRCYRDWSSDVCSSDLDRTSLAGKAAGEVLRRAQAAKKKVAVVAGRVVDLIGTHTVSGQGDTLDLAGVALLGERAAREALRSEERRVGRAGRGKLGRAR